MTAVREACSCFQRAAKREGTSTAARAARRPRGAAAGEARRPGGVLLLPASREAGVDEHGIGAGAEVADALHNHGLHAADEGARVVVGIDEDAPVDDGGGVG